MTIALQGTPTVAELASATTITVTYPSGIQANELLLLHVVDSNTTISTTPPTGWTLATAHNTANVTPSLVTFYKIATGSETGTFTYDNGTGVAAAIGAFCERWSGVNTTTPLDVTGAGSDTGVATNYNAPTLTTVTANAVLVYTIGLNARTAADITAATGTTAISDTTGTSRRFITAYETQASAGASTTRNFVENPTTTTLQWCGITLALRPSSGTNYTPSAADTGSGSDATSQVQNQVQTYADTGAGSDSMALARAQTYADTGSGADVASPVQSVVRTAADTGSGTDATTQVINAQQTLSDTGSGTDATTPIQGMVRTAADTGSGSDSAVASFILIQNQADTGSGADSITVLQNMQPTVSDTGSGTDATTFVQSQSVTVADTGAGSDSISTVVQAIQTVADTGAGADGITQAIGYLRAAADTGSGTDTTATAADNVRTIADNGSGADALAQALSVVRAVSDVGSGSDTITQILGMSRTVADTGTGTDTASYTTISNLIDLFLTSTPLGTRYAVSEIMSRWSTTALAGRWSTAEFTRWSVTPLANRYTTVGESTMGVDVIISAGAVKYVGGTITDVNGADISGSTFQVSLGSSTDPGVWQTPDVSVAGTTNAQRIVKMLVSSSNPTGLQRGTYYCWVRVSSSPEIEPLRVQGPINVR